MVAKNKWADQSAHPLSLISAFVIHLLESILSRLTTCEILYFRLVYVTEQAGLNFSSLETPQDMFSHVEAHIPIK